SWFGLTYCGVAARFFTAFIGLACISNVLFDLQLKYTNVLELLSRPELIINILIVNKFLLKVYSSANQATYNPALCTPNIKNVFQLQVCSPFCNQLPNTHFALLQHPINIEYFLLCCT
uniref:hypothetical protein n=2 Tax=Ferruginibacter sp. TaxID=1940288 RepID=UPI002659E746